MLPRIYARMEGRSVWIPKVASGTSPCPGGRVLSAGPHCHRYRRMVSRAGLPGCSRPQRPELHSHRRELYRLSVHRTLSTMCLAISCDGGGVPVGPAGGRGYRCSSSTCAAIENHFGTLGLTFAGISAAVLMVDYYVQFTTVQTSLVKGELDGGLSVLSQYNPHGVFVALEDVGYFAMSLAFLLTGFALADTRRSERVLRRILIVVGALGVGALPLLVATLGTEMEYSYEVLALTVCWLGATAPAFWLASPRVPPRLMPRVPATTTSRPDRA